MQLSYINWIIFYSSVYDLPDDERPSDEKIRTDSLLDTWVKEHKAKMLAEKANAGSPGKGKLPPPHMIKPH